MITCSALRISSRDGSTPEHFERNVGFDRGAQIGRPVVVERPRTVAALMVQHVRDRALANSSSGKPKKAIEQHLLGRHRDVGLEFARPPALGGLLAQEPVDVARNAVSRTASSSDMTAREQRLSGQIAAADGGFHRVGPAGLGPRAGDRDGRMVGALLPCAPRRLVVATSLPDCASRRCVTSVARF